MKLSQAATCSSLHWIFISEQLAQQGWRHTAWQLQPVRTVVLYTSTSTVGLYTSTVRGTVRVSFSQVDKCTAVHSGAVTVTMNNYYSADDFSISSEIQLRIQDKMEIGCA